MITIEPHVTNSITSSVYKQLKHQLMIGALKPGESLTLKSLSNSFGVSQTPVREAILRLVSDRVLSLIHGRSATVPILSIAEFSELREIRMRLESFAIEQAIEHLDDASIAEIVEAHERYMERQQAEDYVGVLITNIDFHFKIYKAANMPNLLAMIETLWAQTGPYLGFLYTYSLTQHPDGHPHEFILAALKKRDKVAAVDALNLDMRRHGDPMLKQLIAAGQFQKTKAA